jgi:hypothetical protein
MSRLRGFEDAVLAARVRRLQRSEGELQVQLRGRIAELERAGHWVPTDPAYKRLSALLKNVRVQLDNAEQEQVRRRLAAKASIKPSPATAHGRLSSILGPKLAPHCVPGGNAPVQPARLIGRARRPHYS